MAFAPIVSGRYNTTVLSPSGIAVAQRIELPNLGETAFRVGLESVNGTSQAYYFLFGDSAVVATTTNAMQTKQAEFPVVFGIPPGVTHLSVVTNGGTSGLNITFGDGA